MDQGVVGYFVISIACCCRQFLVQVVGPRLNICANQQVIPLKDYLFFECFVYQVPRRPRVLQMVGSYPTLDLSKYSDDPSFLQASHRGELVWADAGSQAVGALGCA